jgi:hypothetical protein
MQGDSVEGFKKTNPIVENSEPGWAFRYNDSSGRKSIYPELLENVMLVEIFGVLNGAVKRLGE